MNLAAVKAVKQLPEEHLCFLVFVVVLDIVLESLQEVDVGTEQIDDGLGCRNDLLLQQLGP